MNTTHLEFRQSLINAYLKEGYKLFKAKASSAVFIVKKHETGKVSAKGWQGKAKNHSFFYSFPSIARCEKYLTEWLAGVAAKRKDKADRKAAKSKAIKDLKASDHYQVGDVLCNSWGYDQTNVDFYQVTKVLDKSIEICEIAQKSSDSGGAYGGKCQPCRNHFIGESRRKTLQIPSWAGREREEKRAYVSMRHGWCSKWDGKALYCSSHH